MKKSALLLLISGTVLLLASCSRRSYPVENRYPNERYPNERYPNERPVVVYTPPPQDLPPGQAKKVYGGHDAREYAHAKKYHKKKYVPVYGQRGYPLIIIRTPDIVILRNNYGRPYFRNRDGLFYWLRDDNRFYLDERYIRDVEYDEDEYRRWYGVVRPANDPRYEDRRRGDDDDDDDRRGRGRGRGKGKD